MNFSRTAQYVVTLFVFLLYFIPYHQSTSLLWKENSEIEVDVFETKKISSLSEKPFYQAGFINELHENRMSHVSSISTTPSGKTICLWYSGSSEGAQDVCIYSSFFENGTWSSPKTVIDRRQCSRELRRHVRKLGNSVIFSNGKRLWLFFSSTTIGGWSMTSLNYKYSLDDGDTWSRTRKMKLTPFLNLTNNVKNQALFLNDGSFLLPVYREFETETSQVVWVKPFEHTIHYQIRKMSEAHKKAIQPSLIHKEGNKLVSFLRNSGPSRNKKFILRTESEDLGYSWSPLEDTTLPNPNSGFDMLKLPNGNYLGVINYSFIARNDLSIVISYDEGKTWIKLKTIEHTPFTTKAEEKKYSYPTLIRDKQGFYHISYTYHKAHIKHITFNDAWIKEQEGVAPLTE